MCLCVCTFYAKICTKDMMICNFMLVSIILSSVVYIYIHTQSFTAAFHFALADVRHKTSSDKTFEL
jgi:hypothetical protein